MRHPFMQIFYRREDVPRFKKTRTASQPFD